MVLTFPRTDVVGHGKGNKSHPPSSCSPFSLNLLLFALEEFLVEPFGIPAGAAIYLLKHSLVDVVVCLLVGSPEVNLNNNQLLK